MNNPNTSPDNNSSQNPTGWENVSGYNKEKEQARQFTNNELERLAKITGRVPDDEGVKELNLALRYREYEKHLNAYNEAKRTNTMMQQGPMEDLATAKRELEEAMYLYDQSFAKRDAEIAALNEEQRRRNIKDQEKSHQPGSGRHMYDSGRSWVQARLERNQSYDKKRESVAQSREESAKRLEERMPDLVSNIEQSEVYLTYDLNKEGEPSIRERRSGFDDVGKDGLYNEDYSVDLTLYPHAPETPSNPDNSGSSSESNPENPDNPDNPDEPNGPEDTGESNPDDPNGHNKEESGEKNNPDDKEKAKLRAEKEKMIKDKEESLKKNRTAFAERYAKNRSIIPGYRDKDDFLKKKEEFENNLDDLLRSKAELAWEDEQGRIGAELEKELAKLNEEDGDFEEKKAKLMEKYDKEYEKSRNKLKEKFVEDFINEQRKLEEETIDKLDNGNLIRKMVHAFRSNKKVKVALAAAAVAGLGMAFVATGGLGAGALGIGYHLTGAGFAGGAVKGAIGGLLSSRQDSKTSAVRGYEKLNEEEIRERLNKILNDAEEGNNENWLGINDETSESENGTEKSVKGSTKNVASWILGEYEKANDADYAGNWKRTAKGVAIGGLLGGLASGLQISRTSILEQQGDIQVDLSKVDIPEGHGAYDTFTQLGGNPKDLDKALAIMEKLDLQSGGQFVPGSNSETIGLNGLVGDFAHTYPGPISTWPSAAQTYIKAVAKEWAKEGLIDYTRETIEIPIKHYVSTGLAQFLAGAVAGDVVGGMHSTVERTSDSSNSNPRGENTGGANIGGANTGEQNRTEVEKNPADVASADNIRREIAERRAKASAARIKAEIAARKENEAKRRSSDANEEVTAAEERVEQSANKEPSEETKASVTHLKAEVAKRKENAETEMRRANEASVAAIKAKAAERAANEALIAAEKSAAEGIRAQVAARRATT